MLRISQRITGARLQFITFNYYLLLFTETNFYYNNQKFHCEVEMLQSLVVYMLSSFCEVFKMNPIQYSSLPSIKDIVNEEVDTVG